MTGTDDDDAKEASDAANEAEEKSPKKKLKTSRKLFNLDHIDAIGKNTNNFKDFSNKMVFTSRGGFAASVASVIARLIRLNIEVLDSGKLYMERGTAFVFSTVPGAGKTCSMLVSKTSMPPAQFHRSIADFLWKALAISS